MASRGPDAEGRSPANFPPAPLDPSTCPDRATLAAFDRGELSADTSEPVAAHVEACAACQAVLGELAGLPDALPDGLRQVRQAGAEQPGPTLLTGSPVSAAVLAPPGYELLEKVGSGGMGVVYRARDVRLNREVAVKFLREDYPAGSAACTRFVAEAQITGQLQHPGVPAVHELGMLPDGRPFLAMKLVKGRTLHELLKERPEPAQERGRFVAIFEQICQAVGYAHAHRVLHRDLKPANVMVGAFGEVQVMDWGLAKVLAATVPAVAGADAELPETMTAFTAIDTPLAGDSGTRTGAIMGTPAYMPPEQAGGEIRKLDARSDVFGLGAILCQIVTGQPPFSGKDGNEVRLKAVRGELQEAFARLDGAGAEPDLIALCKKCLAFRQGDRPADGRAVAQEVARIRTAAEERARQAELERAAALVREAEQRKRRRQLLVAAGLVATVLAAGIVGTTLGLLQARRAAEAERLAKHDAEDQKTNAEQANEQAQKRLKQIERGNEVLVSIFKDLDIRQIRRGTDPVEAVLAKRLVKVAEQVEGEAVGDPLAVAQLQNDLGLTLLNLGYPNEAIPLAEKARGARADRLGADDPDTLSSMNNLAWAYEDAGRLDEAIRLYEDTLRLKKAKLGADDPNTLNCMNGLASTYSAAGQPQKALPLFVETLRLRKAELGADDRDTLISMNNLAGGYRAAGEFDKALPLLNEALRLTKAKLGADHPDTLAGMNNLATCYHDDGQLAKALSLHEETLRLRKARLGPDHPDTIHSMANLARGYHDDGQLDKALPLYEETLRLFKTKLGADHPDTLLSMNNLAAGYRAAGQRDKALTLLEESLPLCKAKLGFDHPTTLMSMSNLAGAYQDTRQFSKALPLYEEMLRLYRAKLGTAHPGTLKTMNNLATGYHAAGQFDKALPLYQETLRLKRARLGADHPDTLRSMNNLALGYRAAGHLEEALPLYEEMLRLRRTKLGSDHPDTLSSMAKLAAAYCEAGRGEKAVPLMAEHFERLRKRTKPNDPALATELAGASRKLLLCKCYREAEPYLRECLAIREKVRPDAWTTFDTRSLLGGALLGQKKYADAEPLLLQGYEGMKQREAKVPKEGKAPLTEAVERLVELYDAWGKPAEASRWRKELAHGK